MSLPRVTTVESPKIKNQKRKLFFLSLFLSDLCNMEAVYNLDYGTCQSPPLRPAGSNKLSAQEAAEHHVRWRAERADGLPLEQGSEFLDGEREDGAPPSFRTASARYVLDGVGRELARSKSTRRRGPGSSSLSRDGKISFFYCFYAPHTQLTPATFLSPLSAAKTQLSFHHRASRTGCRINEGQVFCLLSRILHSPQRRSRDP